MTSEHFVPTLADVAAEARVSTATVSRCLNLPDMVSPTARDRVMKAVEKLGYTPNFSARAMAAKRTYTIGAIIPTMENAIFARGLQAFQEELHARGYTLLVASSAYRPEIEAEQIKALVARGADGLLLIGYDRDPSIYSFLQRRQVPVMNAWAYTENDKRPAVGFENRAAMRALADRVLDLGHRNIAMISGVLHGNDRAQGRLQGVQDALENRNLPTDISVIETSYEVESGADAFKKLHETAPKTTAVICGNDVLAVGAIQQAQAMGMSVPNDISVTGFDDIELARIVSPPLTTVHVPHREMGKKAATALINMIEGNSKSVSIKLKSWLIERESLKSVNPRS